MDNVFWFIFGLALGFFLCHGAGRLLLDRALAHEQKAGELLKQVLADRAAFDAEVKRVMGELAALQLACELAQKHKGSAAGSA